MTLIYFVWAYVTSYLCALNKSVISIFKNMIFWWFLRIFMWVSHNFDCFFCYPDPGGQNDANDGFYFSKPTNIDQVYIHRWSMWVAFKEVDGLIVSRTFFCHQEIPGPNILQTFQLGNSRAQPYCIRHGSIGPICKSESRDFRITHAKHRL